MPHMFKWDQPYGSSELVPTMPVHKYLRFAPPMALALVGLVAAMWFVDTMAARLIYADPAAGSSSLIRWINGNVRADITGLITYAPLFTFAVYLLLGIPVSCILALVTRIMKITSYDIDIVKIGQDFGAGRMLRRAAMPALFSLSFSGVLSGFIPDFILEPLTVDQAARPFYFPLESIAMILVVLPLILAFFIPTWMLDDSGVVMHLKEKHLKTRRPPDTEGVGRWWSNLQSGFTLVTAPIVAFVQYFYYPLLSGEVASPFFVIRGLLLSLGIPFLAIAFTLPVIILNEILVGTASKAVRRFVKSLGARELEVEMKLTQAGSSGESKEQRHLLHQNERLPADNEPTRTG